MNRFTLNHAPAFEHHPPESGMTQLDPESFTMDGVQYVPAKGAMAGYRVGAGCSDYVGVLLQRDQTGLFMNYTPLGARALAEALLRAADTVEQARDGDTREAIAKAIGKWVDRAAPDGPRRNTAAMSARPPFLRRAGIDRGGCAMAVALVAILCFGAAFSIWSAGQ